MKNLFFALAIFCITGSLFACNVETNNQTKEGQTKATVTDISVDEFNKLRVEKPGIALDVRTPGEVSEGKVEGATVIDITQGDFMKKAAELDKSKPIYVYCKAGGRSANASQKLIELGYTNVYNVLGGMDAWKQKGLPLTK